MSFEDGWAALHLEMPKRVPRTEYSLDGHWEVLCHVTGTDVNGDSDPETRLAACKRLFQEWNYDLMWGTLISGQVFGDLRTMMGHAEYAAGGVDFDTDIRCPFRGPEEVLAFDPWVAYGEIDKKQVIRDFEADYRNKTKIFPDMVQMTGIYVTSISGVLDIFGWDLLLQALGLDPRGFGEVMNRYASWIQQYFDALAEADVPVAMIHDDIVWSSGPFARPDWYREFVFPHYHKYIRPLVDSGKKILFTSDGDYTVFVDDIAAAGVQGFCMEPMTDMRTVAEKYGKTHAIVGNADTRILLRGNKDEIRAEVERCMAIGKGCPGFFLSVGNHIPPNTPLESVLYYNKVYEETCWR